MADQGKEEERAKSPEIEVSLLGPPPIPLLLSDYFAIQFVSTGIVLGFYQVQPPHISSPEEREAVKQIPAYCVSKIVVSREQAGIIVQMLQAAIEQLSKAQATPAAKK